MTETLLSNNYEGLEKSLGYCFSDQSLLRQALTHRSYSALHNERFEFIGDSILNYVIARILYEKFLSLDEGDLSLLRAQLVNQKTLFDVARSIHLGNYILLGEGEIKNHGFDRPSILADTLEALLAAICFDGDFSSAEKVVCQLFATKIDGIDLTLQKDAKTELQEILQSKHLALPQYTLLNESSQKNKKLFTVLCEIASIHLRVTGKGSNKRLAEQAAAKKALDELFAQAT